MVFQLRSARVILDSDLAKVYGVSTSALNQAVKRGAGKFPSDFAYQITREELDDLKSHSVISSRSLAAHGGRRTLPWVFTEHGAIMAAMVLRSEKAIAMSVYVVRAFVEVREMQLNNSVLLRRIAQIDKRLLEHDVVLKDLIEKLLPLISSSNAPPRTRKIGFFQPAD